MPSQMTRFHIFSKEVRADNFGETRFISAVDKCVDINKNLCYYLHFVL